MQKSGTKINIWFSFRWKKYLLTVMIGGKKKKSRDDLIESFWYLSGQDARQVCAGISHSSIKEMLRVIQHLTAGNRYMHSISSEQSTHNGGKPANSWDGGEYSAKYFFKSL